jgi:HK97 family phage major capsid protein
MPNKELNTLETKAQEKRTLRAAKVQEMHDLSLQTSFPAEAQTRWDALHTEQMALETEIRTIETTIALQKEMRTFTPPPVAVPSQTFTETRDAAKSAEIETRAFNAFLSGGWTAVNSNEELRTYAPLDSTQNTGQTGFTIPIQFMQQLEVKMKAYGGMLNDCNTVLSASGSQLLWPIMDDTANSGSWLAENGTANQTNPAFSNVAFTSNLASSDQVLISIQALNDTAFDLSGVLNSAFAVRLGRLLNAAYTNGSGSGQPKGILGVSGIGSVTNVGDPQTGNTSANSIGVDDLNAVQFAVDDAYRNSPKARYHFGSSTLTTLMKLKNSLGNPIFVASVTAGAPDTILGKPYTINYSMPTIASGHKPVLFGDFDKYVIRKVGEAQVFRYNELYMPNKQIGFEAYLRTDGQCIQPAAFAVITQP